MSEHKPGQPHQPENQLDEDAIAFAQGIFELARNGGTKMLSPLLEAGVPVDIRTSSGDSLLMLATYNGHVDAARLLLEKGADPDLANDRLQTPLMCAAMFNRTNMIVRLLEAGADPLLQDAEGNTALSLARAMDAQDVIKHLDR